MLLWLWPRPAAVVLIQPLAWQLSYAAGGNPKKQKKKKKKKKKEKKKKERKKERRKEGNGREMKHSGTENRQPGQPSVSQDGKELE